MENITENKADQIIKVVCEYYKQKRENVFLVSREKDYVIHGVPWSYDQSQVLM
jgi:chromosomal replication initiation ATPase DnaA